MDEKVIYQVVEEDNGVEYTFDYDNEKEAIEHCSHLLQAAEDLEISTDVYNVFVVRVTIDSLGNETRHLIYSE